MSTTKYQVTCWGHPNDDVQILVDGYRMNIPYRHWLQMEIDRWADKNCRAAWVEESKEGLIAMFTDAEGMVELSPEE